MMTCYSLIMEVIAGFNRPCEMGEILAALNKIDMTHPFLKETLSRNLRVMTKSGYITREKSRNQTRNGRYPYLYQIKLIEVKP